MPTRINSDSDFYRLNQDDIRGDGKDDTSSANAGGTVIVSDALGTPVDTEATTDTGTFSVQALLKRLLNTKLSDYLSQIANAVNGTLTVDGSASTQPISASNLPLPSDASTETTSAALSAALGGQADAAATGTGSFSAIAFLKGLWLRLDNLYRVFCTGQKAGGSADNAAVSGTIAAPGAGFAVLIRSALFSYSDTPSSSKNLTIGAGGAALDISITTGGPGPVPIGWLAAENTAVAYSLPASGTAGQIGKLNVYYSIVRIIP